MSIFSMCGSTVKLDKLGTAYGALLTHVLSTGQEVNSRVGRTKELLNLRLQLDDPRYCIVGREGMSRVLMHEEILQVLAGIHDNDRIREITPKAADLTTAQTAYGPRTWEQVEWCAEELYHHPTSRRAVVYVGRHDDLISVDNGKRAGEMPCTETWQFHLRENTLHMTVNMRSWDLVWGLSFDIPMFVAVQLTVARHLDAKLGTYVHTAGSAHVYEQHWNIKTWPEERELKIDYVLRDTVEATRHNARWELGR